MKLTEAVDILDKAGYLVESPEFSKLDRIRFGSHFDKTKISKGKRNAMAKFSDPETYNDREGIKWTYVKKRDDLTLKCAIVDGMIDTGSSDVKYDDITSEEQIDKIISDNDFAPGVVKSILEHLHKYMKGTTTVYRGFKRTWRLADLKDPRKKNALMQELSNTNKEFNSFTTDIDIAEGFAGSEGIVIAAEVEPNDIMFAFTAYLMGRHGGIEELELNISNMKSLRNARFLSNTDILRIKGYTRQVYRFDNGTVLMARQGHEQEEFVPGIIVDRNRPASDYLPVKFLANDKNTPDGVLMLYNWDLLWKMYCDGHKVKVSNGIGGIPHFMSDHFFHTLSDIYAFDRDENKAMALQDIDYITEKPERGQYRYQLRIWKKDGKQHYVWVDGELNPDPDEPV